MALTEKEKDAIRTLAEYFDSCGQLCEGCDFVGIGVCAPVRCALLCRKLGL